MAFNPLEEKGIPIEKQFRNWSALNVKPYDKDSVHPYTRTRGIFMNGIEVEAALFTHQFARHTDNMDLKQKLAMVRRVEQQQQKAVNWVIPGNESTLEVTIGYEQVAVDLTAWLAQNEPDPYVKQALDFALLEDFDHLYRYANLMQVTNGKAPADVVGNLTEITVGRPTVSEHRHPFDDVRKHYDSKTAEFVTKMNVMTIVAAEQQTMNFYMNVGNRPQETVGRGLYLEIGQIEEQHVTHYESLLDPRSSWLECLLLHEYHECYLYYSMMQQEPHPEIKKIWDLHLNMELEHLRIACDLFSQYEKRDPAEILPKEIPPITKFQSNVDYVRKILASQTDYTAMGTEFVPAEKMPTDYRYYKYQKMVNGDGVPSEQVVSECIKKRGIDYRLELKEPHPVERFRQDAVVRREEEEGARPTQTYTI